ncbi:hypothetical protein RRG08_025613 [Elysia crispata]|uniref:Uncharacterized protein n=1 Tax=Elysia crispata TaxID=231223 RepID=A0AAE0YEA7_9GAST|nr:hypothetical protein RRG08_025613 [Elysia crispata]
MALNNQPASADPPPWRNHCNRESLNRFSFSSLGRPVFVSVHYCHPKAYVDSSKAFNSGALRVFSQLQTASFAIGDGTSFGGRGLKTFIQLTDLHRYQSEHTKSDQKQINLVKDADYFNPTQERHHALTPKAFSAENYT